MEVHDFGPAAQYLFRPCELDDDFFDTMERQAQTNKEEEVDKPNNYAMPMIWSNLFEFF
jgi:hypothetical protein